MKEDYYGGFFRRLIAFLLDSFVIALITYTVYYTVETFVGVFSNGDPAKGLSYAWQALSYSLPALYFILFWGSAGQTPGKAALGLKVINESGGPVGYGTAFLRYIGYTISFLILGLGFIWIIFDGRKQGWHDKIPGTVVVRTKRYAQIRPDAADQSMYQI